MKNATSDAREGPPTATAGLFMWSHTDFAKDANWIHVDIAAPAFDKVSALKYFG